MLMGMTVIVIILVFTVMQNGAWKYIIAGVMLSMLFIQILNFFRKSDEIRLVDKDDATAHYVKWMQDNRNITIPPDFQEHFSDETPQLYRFVFKFRDFDTGYWWYCPIEIYKYYVLNKDDEEIIQLGHGRGTITQNIDKVEEFVLRDVKQAEVKQVVKVVQQQIDDIIDRKLADQQEGTAPTTT